MNYGAQPSDSGAILQGVDWRRLRELLREHRLAAKLNQSALAEAIGVDKSTINRIENVYGEPDHEPRLETVEAWIRGTGSTLGELFTELDLPLVTVTDAEPVPIAGHQLRALPPAGHEETHGTTSSLHPPDTLALEVLKDFVHELSVMLTLSLNECIRRAEAARPPPNTDTHRSGSG